MLWNCLVIDVGILTITLKLCNHFYRKGMSSHGHMHSSYYYFRHLLTLDVSSSCTSDMLFFSPAKIKEKQNRKFAFGWEIHRAYYREGVILERSEVPICGKVNKPLTKTNKVRNECYARRKLYMDYKYS